MNMTHYMELLADNQPWNLIIFMAIPVILAETLAITELYLLFTRKFNGIVFLLNRFSGITVGIYFVGIIYYLMTNAVIPITRDGAWRTMIDVVAVGAYLIAGLPLIWIALQEIGLIHRGFDPITKLKTHAICVAIFLVFGHIAMIAGMVDPTILGYKSSTAHHTQAETGFHSNDMFIEDMAQLHKQHSANPSVSTDNRILVAFPPFMKEHTLANMRDHLLTITQIQEAMGKGQFDKAAKLAEDRLGMSSLQSHGALENAKFMPKAMQDMGELMHRNASKFAIEVQNSSVSGDLKPALNALSNITQACVACHAGFKLQ